MDKISIPPGESSQPSSIIPILCLVTLTVGQGKGLKKERVLSGSLATTSGQEEQVYEEAKFEEKDSDKDAFDKDVVIEDEEDDEKEKLDEEEEDREEGNGSEREDPYASVRVVGEGRKSTVKPISSTLPKIIIGKNNKKT